jgi:hypothetical protein
VLVTGGEDCYRLPHLLEASWPFITGGFNCAHSERVETKSDYRSPYNRERPIQFVGVFQFLINLMCSRTRGRQHLNRGEYRPGLYAWLDDLATNTQRLL